MTEKLIIGEGKFVVAFDCDGTLLRLNEKPNDDVIAILKMFSKLGAFVIIWSGGGDDWARRVADKCGVLHHADMIIAKDNRIRIDLAFDDEPEFNMAEKVIIVK